MKMPPQIPLKPELLAAHIALVYDAEPLVLVTLVPPQIRLRRKLLVAHVVRRAVLARAPRAAFAVLRDGRVHDVRPEHVDAVHPHHARLLVGVVRQALLHRAAVDVVEVVEAVPGLRLQREHPD